VQHAVDSTTDMPGGWLRPVYLLLGVVSLAIAFIGVFLPLIPTTGPVLLAAFFFARSSRRIHGWLIGHPRFGRMIEDFQAGRGIPRRAKVVAVTMMTAAFTYSTVWAVSHPAARVAVALVGVLAIGYVLRLPDADRSEDRTTP
jgi:uncharacterized membrane protein YbaN (DUF454 family)